MTEVNDQMMSDLLEVQTKVLEVLDRKELASVFKDVGTFMERVRRLKHFKMSTKKDGYKVQDLFFIPKDFEYKYA